MKGVFGNLLGRLGRLLGFLEASYGVLVRLLGRLGASGVQFLMDIGTFSFKTQ